jgi:hypothetical protein
MIVTVFTELFKTFFIYSDIFFATRPAQRMLQLTHLALGTAWWVRATDPLFHPVTVHAPSLLIQMKRCQSMPRSFRNSCNFRKFCGRFFLFLPDYKIKYARRPDTSAVSLISSNCNVKFPILLKYL